MPGTHHGLTTSFTFSRWSGHRRCWGPAQRGKSVSGRKKITNECFIWLLLWMVWLLWFTFDSPDEAALKVFNVFNAASGSIWLLRWPPRKSLLLFVANLPFTRPGMMPPFSVPDYVLPKPKILWGLPCVPTPHQPIDMIEVKTTFLHFICQTIWKVGFSLLWNKLSSKESHTLNLLHPPTDPSCWM